MKKLLVSIALLTFILVGLFGMNLSMGMDKNGKMTNCPLMSGPSSLCQMGVTEHISKWLQMFQAVPFSSVFTLFVLGLFFIAWSISSKTYFALAPPERYSSNLYQKEHPDSRLFNSLLLAFYNGIIQPTIYA